jgi:hypothetical protein
MRHSAEVANRKQDSICSIRKQLKEARARSGFEQWPQTAATRIDPADFEIDPGAVTVMNERGGVSRERVTLGPF